MRRKRLAAALVIIGAAVAALTATGSAAQAAAVRFCAVGNLRAMTPTWAISCTRPARVNIDVVSDAMNNAIPPSAEHSEQVMHQLVTPTTPWIDSMFFPGSWYAYQICVTVTADGATIGSTCFHRSSARTAPCGVNALGGLNPEWAFGCPGGSSNVDVDLSYHYTLAGDPTTHYDHRVFSYTMAQWQMTTDGYTPPAGVTIVDSAVTVTDTNTGEMLGAVTYSN